MMHEEGYIKFKCNWIKSKPLPIEKIKEINEWRDKLYSLGLIGAYEDGIGFGNISVRWETSNQFIITGSKTGNFKSLNEQHYTLVTDFNLEENSLTCKGPIEASSESLTHGTIYKANPEINAVIHVHSVDLWMGLIDKIPTTSKTVEYGTPEMAKEIIRLFRESDVKDKDILVMGGHEGGILSFGENLNEAGIILLSYLTKK